MAEIRSVLLDIVRPGPAHNQLLSPLTPYLALCGAEGPVTISIPFEQRQLLNRLQLLRYVNAAGQPIPSQQREAEARELGETLGRVLSQVPALFSELGDARTDSNTLVQLRLSLSPFELGMVPFEFAIAPDGFPGSGSPLFLQTRTPITVTREIRRGRPLYYEWDRTPLILFAYAAPGDLAAVPADDHLRALRAAIDPWVYWSDSAEERVENVKKILTVLPDATLESIRDACAAHPYTHVHILAHGAPLEAAEDRRYGVALFGNESGRGYDVVDGERLAIALTARDALGVTRHRPTVVTLATCDSGNVGTLLTPGGSIAHELHAAGIPWVIASQFPLWMRASSVASDVLYSGILRGDDPRWVLYELRQRLRTDSPGTHDWASIVAYASVTERFGSEVEAFRDNQTQRKTDIKFDKADKFARLVADESSARLHELCESIRDDFAVWRMQLSEDAPAKVRSRRLGMSGACEKRIAILYTKAGETDLANAAYRHSRDFYQAALDADPWSHWAMTQYLSVLATPMLSSEHELSDLQHQYAEMWKVAKEIASWELKRSSGPQQAWPLATLAELTLLGAVYGGETFDRDDAIEAIGGYCSKLVEIAVPDRFPVFSSERQFNRYAEFWRRDEWAPLAQAALDVLGRKKRAGGKSKAGN